MFFSCATGASDLVTLAELERREHGPESMGVTGVL
jgi:hypothetical protein